jgi:glycine cleavage system regulatory protein
MALVVLTVIGADRPGLTQILADAVLSAGGSWQESHLSRLGGQYVGSVLVEIEEHAKEALERAVLTAAVPNLEVRLAPAGSRTAPSGEVLVFSLVGQDRPGIVRQVTTALSALEVNIEEFVTTLDHEAYSGAPLFHAKARLRLPGGLAIRAVQEALEQISGEIMVDVSLGAPRPGAP